MCELENGDLLSDPYCEKSLYVIDCEIEPIGLKHRVFTLRVALDHTFFALFSDGRLEWSVWGHISCRYATALCENNSRIARGIAEDYARGLRVVRGATKSGQPIAYGVADLDNGFVKTGP